LEDPPRAPKDGKMGWNGSYEDGTVVTYKCPLGDNKEAVCEFDTWVPAKIAPCKEKPKPVKPGKPKPSKKPSKGKGKKGKKG